MTLRILSESSSLNVSDNLSVDSEDSQATVPQIPETKCSKTIAKILGPNDLIPIIRISDIGQSTSCSIHKSKSLQELPGYIDLEEPVQEVF